MNGFNSSSQPHAEFVDGLVIGCRKCATSWLHQNFLKDQQVATTLFTKETSFFTSKPTVTPNQYREIFQKSDNSLLKIECDASICYDETATSRIAEYAPSCKLVLIMRNPYDYLISRFVHSMRKGEISKSLTLEEFIDLDWIQEELDYEKISSRFKGAFNKRLLVIQYESISNEAHFYSNILSHLSSGVYTDATPPLLNIKVNTMRSSKLPEVSIFITRTAHAARKYGLHKLVSAIKSTNVHKLLEHSESDNSKSLLHQQALNLKSTILKSSYELWSTL